MMKKKCAHEDPALRAGLIQSSKWTECTIDDEKKNSIFMIKKKILSDKDPAPGAGLIQPTIWIKCTIDDEEKNSTTRLNKRKRINKLIRITMDSRHNVRRIISVRPN